MQDLRVLCSEVSNRFGTMLIVFGVLENMILHVFSKFHFFGVVCKFFIWNGPLGKIQIVSGPCLSCPAPSKT